MRKYHQLLLFAFSAVSILCFVFYKHEYDRLRRVLEILDLFGSPSEASNKSSQPIGVTNPLVEDTLEIIPDAWQSYSDDIQFYSAVRTVNEKGWSMNSLAVVRRNATTIIKKFTCALISGDSVEDKFEGTIEWKPLGNDSHFFTYSVICNVPEVPGNSHIYSLYETNSNNKPLNLPLNLGRELRKEKLVSMCALSTEPLWRTAELVDFILYHSALGVNSITIFHRGVSNQALLVLKELVRKHSNLSIAVSLWNTPKFSSEALDLNLVSHTCSLRQNAKAGTVILMPMGNFLAIPKEETIHSFLSHLTQQTQSVNHEARLKVVSLCSNIPNGESSPRRQHQYYHNLKKESKSATLRWFEIPVLNSKPTGTKVDSRTVKFIVFEPCPLNGNQKVTSDLAVQAFGTIALKITS